MDSDTIVVHGKTGPLGRSRFPAALLSIWAKGLCMLDLGEVASLGCPVLTAHPVRLNSRVSVIMGDSWVNKGACARVYQKEST